MPQQGRIGPPLSDTQLMEREYENGELRNIKLSNIEGLLGSAKGRQRRRLRGGDRKPLNGNWRKSFWNGLKTGVLADNESRVGV